MNKLYKLLPEHEAKIPEHNEKWKDIILNTNRLSEVDKKLCVDSVNKMYDLAKLPRPENIVFVSNPILLAFAAGLSRFIWKERLGATESATESATDSAKYSATDSATDSATYGATLSATDSATESATYSATYSATESATESATDSATRSATLSATYSATGSATYGATESATDSATYSATRSATYGATLSATDSATLSATRSATYSATYGATESATDSATYSATRSATYSATLSATDSATLSATEISNGVVLHENINKEIDLILDTYGLMHKKKEALGYIRGITSVWQGGCNWASFDCFLSFFQDICCLDTGVESYKPYKDLTVAGYRVLDKKFAMISEKFTVIKMKGNLAHNLNGAAIEYMDGTKLYMAYGNLIPSYIVTTPVKDITKDMILNEKNADFRRYLIERIGIDKYIQILGVDKILDTYESKVGGLYELLRVDINGEKCLYLKMKNQSEFVWHIEGVANNVKTVKEALMFRNGLKKFKEPKFLS